MKKTLLILTTAFVSLISFSQVPNYVPTNGLVGYWPFNGNANDESGNGNNGTVNGATLTTDRFGVANKAYSFDGVSSKIVVVNSPSLNIALGQAVSISCWIKHNAGSTNINTYFISKYDGLSSIGPAYAVGTGNTGNAYSWHQIAAGIPNGVEIIGENTMNDGNWHQVVSVLEMGVASRVYIDGILDSAVNFPLTGSIINTINLHFGCGANLAQYYAGNLDDIGIWNRALTQCEIQDLFNAQLNSVAVNAGTDQTLCEGQSTSLFGSGASTYTWNNNVQNGVGFVPTATSSYTVTGTDANGCIGTDTVNIVVNNNSSSTLNETALDSYTLNGQTYTQSGTYTQNLPNAAGCDSTITLNLTLNFTGLNELENSISIAPNPATDQLTISCSSSLNENYILFDPQGRSVLSGKLSGTTTQLDLSKLARGNYLLQIGDKKTPVKLVKE